MKFLTPSKTTKKREKSIFTKEPDTIEWIDNMSGVLYDIGANVGTYSIYAGLKGVEVYAFEPEIQNCALLNENIRLNNLTNVKAFNLALNDWPMADLDYLNLSTTEVGGSLHAFGENLDYKLESFEPVYRQGCVGVALDVIAGSLPKPDHIKIDVDGFEHLVYLGGQETINQAKSVLIEINRNVPQHMELIQWMCDSGFTYNKSQSDKAERKGGRMKGVGNFIFYKEQV